MLLIAVLYKSCPNRQLDVIFQLYSPFLKYKANYILTSTSFKYKYPHINSHIRYPYTQALFSWICNGISLKFITERTVLNNRRRPISLPCKVVTEMKYSKSCDKRSWLAFNIGFWLVTPFFVLGFVYICQTKALTSWFFIFNERKHVVWFKIFVAVLSYAQQGFHVVRMSTSEIDDSLFQNHPQRYEKTISYYSDTAIDQRKIRWLERDLYSHHRVSRPPLYPLSCIESTGIGSESYMKYFRDDLI